VTVDATQPSLPERATAGRDGDLTGRTFGDFVIAEKIGEGGFGAVYRAHQPLLDRPAVIKVLHVRHRAAAATTQRFLREARLASRLDHPYAAHIYAFGAESDGTLWIAMEMVRGTTLSEYLRVHGPLAVERLVPLLERICEVVHTAHEQGIIHRDLKPANVMVVARAGRLLPKLLDFGIAKSLIDAPDDEPERAPARPDADLATGDTISPPSPDATIVEPPRASRRHSGGHDVRLTQRGAVMGSPHYMAPEQWEDATTVTARTDLYALGVLAYEALTGHPPFREATVAMLALAHTTAEVPPLPPALPAGLGTTFARALAKQPEDRFETALEMAAAFRVAAGLGQERRPLPQIDLALRERYLADAPQPIAEAIAALEAAHDPRHVRDALWVIPSVLVRWLAALALAARSRLGTSHDGPSALAAVRELATSAPPDDRWLELVHDIVRGYAATPDLHPIPELVLFACGDGAHEYRAFAAMRAQLADTTANDDVLVERLRTAMVAATALLRSAELVCDYQLVLSRGDGLAESWAGTRRAHRAPVTLARLVEPGQPVLLDRDGIPVAVLDPLVQVAEPGPGLVAELFLYSGHHVRGARLQAPPSTFELHDPRVLEWLRVQMASTLEPERAAIDERAPYRGLAAFGAEDTQFYVGREQLVDTVINRLRVLPLLAVVGPSGAGKSSLVQAGVIPALAGWRAIIVRPGPAPLIALAFRLAAAELAAADLATSLAREPARLGDLLRDAAAARGPIVLVIDQLEEVFTLARDPDERDAFVAAIVSAARAPDDSVRVVITLRDDFLLATQAIPALRDPVARGLQLVTTPSATDLERILVEPAERVGYAFEDPELPARMVADVADRPGALALLSFTAAQLWEQRDRHFHKLPTRAYEQLGGVGGALARHADTVLDAAPSHEQRLIREAFRHLVTSENTRAVLTRGELAEVMGGGTAADTAIERLIASRLLVAREGDAEDQIEIAHEALITAWPRLVEWRREDQEGARLRDQLRAAARQWEARGRPRGLLWRDDALLEYQLWRSRYPGTLTAIEEAFAATSIADVTRGKRFRRGLLAAAFTVLVVGVLALSNLNARANRARRDAEQSSEEANRSAQRADDLLTASYEEQGRQAWLSGRGSEALVYLAEAYKRGSTTPALRYLLGRVVLAHSAVIHSVRAHDGRVALQLAPDGGWLASAGGDGALRLWSTEGRRTGELLVTGMPQSGIRISPDGTRVVSFGETATASVWDVVARRRLAELEGDPGRVMDARFLAEDRCVTIGRTGLVRVWNTLDGQLVTELPRHEGMLVSLSVAPDGQRFVTAGFVSGDGTTGARLWDGAGQLVATLDAPYSVLATAFSSDGRWVATGAETGSVAVWDARTGVLRGLLHAHVARVRAIVFDPRTTRMLTTSADGTSRLWDATTLRLVAVLDREGSAIETGAFSRDGSLVVTGDLRGTIAIWDARTGVRVGRLLGHTSGISGLVFPPEPARLISASWDGTLRIWDTSQSERVAVARSGSGSDDAQIITTASFDPSGERIAYAGEAGEVMIADASSGEPLLRFRAHDVPIYEVAYTPDGARLATAAEDGRVRVWESATGRPVATLQGHRGALQSLAIDRSGTRLAAGGHDRQVIVWQLADGAIEQRVATEHVVTGVRWGASGDALLYSTWSEQARVHALSLTGRSLVLRGPAGGITSIEPFHDASRAVTAHMDGSVIVWNDTGERLGIVRHETAVLAATVSPDDALLLTIGSHGAATIWDARTFQLLGTHDIRSADFARGGFDPAGDRFVIAERGQISIWRRPRFSGTIEELDRLVRCVGLRLEDGALAPREVHDPECMHTK
jgi:WD40 repeat protein/serine/threonine protein kinase